ncbi:DNA (cytosine-5)-methyltransferase [Weissella oryzae SG25]|uniref:Methyltransferase n=1 Tax=Weissella oryzae (strain DSM 25784 / JCM 18191 / LMG 30913 / SG25) TaxID=1329250 RepID=A0A069CTZ4_WEIOS|nr:site-specific DNA-methyltransferase [Weissella oryzae]GAK30969.1 DNA (cytosine-5)-methyltransferase [Weissella oryzae SG25]
MSKFFEDKRVRLLKGNSLKLMATLPDESVDVIMTDPPFFLSNGGISVHAGKQVKVDKGEWDKINDGTPEEFYTTFIKHARRILKPNGTIWIFGTMHNIFLVGYLLQKNDWKILNNVTWQKSNPAPNLSGRMFTHSTENIIWARKNAKKGKHFYNYELMKEYNNGKQMKDVWTSSTVKKSEKKFGKHPTQKPLWIMERLIEASTQVGDVILDPFVGSGTTAVAGIKLDRFVIGMDLSDEYLEIARARILDVESDIKLF